MTLTITDEALTSDATRHPDPVPGERGWVVSWMPERVLSRNQAITAMTIAEAVAQQGDHAHALIGSLAHELGMTGPEAIRRVTS